MVTAIAEFDTAAIPVVDASRSPGLSFERRYEIVSEQFADWLVMEPIQFPRQLTRPTSAISTPSNIR